jgi:4-hydroxy-3-methylbut-2-enyl diphosphate reductase
MGRVIISPEELPALPDFPKLLLVSQTTRDPEGFSEMKEAVLDRYGERARVINTICEATIKRQREVAELGKLTDAILVVGGKDSGNTKRLKDIGERLGLPTVSAEGPEDIALDFPGKAHSLGVAAGASTPVWQIRVVVQSLLAREREESGSPLRFLSRLLRVLVLSNVYIGMGVASIGRAMGEALGIGYSHFFFGLFFYFGLLMFLLSGLTQADHVRYNDPDRANFFIKYRKSLTCLCVLSGIMALFSANYLGAKINILIAAQMFLGLLCILPWNQFYKPFNILGYRSLKEIPCMQILTRSAGWSILVICPAFLSEPALLSVSYEDLIKAFFGLTLVFLQVFVRTFIMNMQDARGDRVFSPVTPVHFLGPKWSVRFILAVMGFWALVILISYFWGGLNKLVLIFLITGPAYNVLVLRRFFKNNWLGGYQFDLLLDAQFFLTGLAGLLFWLYR